MSDETKAPGEGEGSPQTEPERAAFEAKLRTLEEAFVEAGKALVAHGKARGVAIPFVFEDRAVVAAFGPPMHVIRMVADAMDQFAEKHERDHDPFALISALLGGSAGPPRVVTVGPGGLGEALAAMVRGAADDTDDEDAQPTPGCDCPRCEHLRQRGNKH